MSGPKSSKSKRKPLHEYAADFETTTTPDDCRVWLWGLSPLEAPDTYEQGIDIESFIDRIADQRTVISFHNLRHDGTFIIDWLFKNGFKYVLDRQDLRPTTFTALISDTGKFYSIQITWTNGLTCELRDSYKKIPMSLARAAKSFQLEESKGEIDYHEHRPVGHQPTPEESDYMRRDTTILSKILRQTRDEGMTRLTVASDSMAEYKHLFGAKRFQRTFPVMSEAMDAEIRQAYRGGYTYADERHKQCITRSGLVLDVNSLYPFIMYDRLLPYGDPEFFGGAPQPTDTHPLTIFSVTFTAKLKADHIPIIQIKKSTLFHDSEYVKLIDDAVTLYVTNVDWELWNEHYNIDVLAYGGGWRFKAAQGLFKEYIDKWSKIKAESTGGLREIAKLHLNSLYGRFAKNPNVTGKVPYLENDTVKYRRGPEEIAAPVYVAMGAFITAYARDLTIRAAQDNYDTFAYCDTDSLHLLRDTIPRGIDVDPHRMGAWKLEYKFKAALYVRPKFYLEQRQDTITRRVGGIGDRWRRTPGKFTNAMAGVPEKVSVGLTFADIYDGRELSGKLRPRNVPGGVVLLDEKFTIKL